MVVLTTAGGWGVVTADAITRDGDIVLMELPADLLAAIDEKLPPRWSRNNPVDCAGGETRDTIPEVLELIADRIPTSTPIIYLGLGIQSNQARMMREGRFYPDHGLERIVDVPRTSGLADSRRRPTSSIVRTGKPILVATELAVADPEQRRPRPLRAPRAAVLPERRACRDGARPPRPRMRRSGGRAPGERTESGQGPRARPADRPRIRRRPACAGPVRHVQVGRRADRRVIARPPRHRRRPRRRPACRHRRCSRSGDCRRSCRDRCRSRPSARRSRDSSRR